MKATDIMTKEFDTVSPSATVKEAVALLRSGKRGEKGTHALMVVDENGGIVGIITISNILRAIIPPYMGVAHIAEFAWNGLFEKMCHKVEDMRVSELMDKRVVTATSDMNLIEIAEIMLKYRIERLPVAEGGRILGIVYKKDLFFTIVGTMLGDGR